MSQLSQTLPKVLRRQARKLTHYTGTDSERELFARLLASCMRAADELEIRQQADSDAHDLLATMVHEQRRLRGTLSDAYVEILQLVPGPRGVALLEQIKATLRSIPPRGQGRRIIGITVGDDSTREFVLEEATDAINAYFDGQAADDAEAAGEFPAAGDPGAVEGGGVRPDGEPVPRGERG